MPAPVDWDAVQAEQVEYYRARAPEYDESWTRRGDYDFGSAFNELWFAEVGRIDAALEDFGPIGRVLELAAGTGMWTERLGRSAASITALDVSPEMLAINRRRLTGSTVPVRHVEADLFGWTPDGRYDVISFAFWLTHVPPPRFEEFWSFVTSALAPQGRVFFADSAIPRAELPVLGRRFGFRGHAVEGVHSLTDLDRGVSVRQVRDGRRFQTVKVYWEPGELQERLRSLGWDIEVRATEWAFVYGHGGRRI
jgi:demethylmenaquinone methyltransferase/2-methoxy-6-polyprenyl-1,4-benzoquinol methylase